jgi:hypothetical protein
MNTHLTVNILRLEIKNGAMAEELGKGLQNPVHECESRSRLHARTKI